MEKSSVYHSSDQTYAYATAEDTINVRLRVKAHDCERVVIYYKNLYDHTDKYFVSDMKPILQDDLAVMYEAEITVPEKHFKYYFDIYSQGEVFHYTGDGFKEHVSEMNCFYYPVVNSDDIITLPEWARGRVIYQIMVDRFCNGDKTNDPPYVKSTDQLPDSFTFYGGDFTGIEQKLDYISELGADMIYLSPVFASPSYHKYDVADYYEIEGIFGGRDALASLVKRAHERKMRVILDAVFNHCSSHNALFQDVVKNGEKSRYAKWFLINSFPLSEQPLNYETFAGAVPDMPRFDTSNPEVQQYLIDSALYWTKELGIDGWRLDVADEVSHTLWRQFRSKMKALSNDILIIGEVWNHAQRWLQSDEFDTVTNYKYRGRLIEFAMGCIDSRTFWNSISANKMNYMTPFYNYLISFADSHDTERCAFCVQDSDIHTLAIAATLTMEGIPLIYYGDEAGMQGGKDPDNRRAMRWDNMDRRKFKTVKALARLRRESAALREGRTEILPSEDRVLAFKRSAGEDSVAVILNFSPDDVSVRGGYRQILLGDGEITGEGINVIGKRFVVVR